MTPSSRNGGRRLRPRAHKLTVDTEFPERYSSGEMLPHGGDAARRRKVSPKDDEGGKRRGAMGRCAPRAEPLFIAHFFYRLSRTGCCEREAWEQAAAHDADSRQYVFWDADGCQRLE